MNTVRARENGYDGWLVFLTIFMLLLGTVIVLDASFARSFQSGQDGFFFFKRQAMWAAIALIPLAVAMKFPYWRLRRTWLIGVVVSTILLVVVMIPGIGIEVNGARRWLGLGPMRFQPSELAKIAMVIFLATYSDLWRGRIRHLTKGFIPAVAVVFLLGGLVAKEDLGTAITMVVTGLLMIFLMGASPKHMLGLVVTAVLGGVALVKAEPYRMERVWAWLDPMKHPDGPGYQPWQGLLALGSGGVWPQAIGRGVAKHLYLPAEHTDYVFATIGEETGLVGTLGLLLLFILLVVRGLTIAHRTKDWFGSLMAAGMTAIVGVQAALNVAVVTCLVPCTGVPLPFISYGGSSLVFTTLAIGIILNISLHADRVSQSAASPKDSHESRADWWGHRRSHLSGA